MLKNSTNKWLFLVTYTVVALIQCISAYQHQLFSDEAFYWLESQQLDWSYAELPGWTQWMIAWSQKWLPQSELTIRLPSLLAALSLPWIGIAVSRAIQSDGQDFWNTGLLFLSLPLFLLAGILALPDIWVIFFGTLAVFVWVKCLKQSSWQWHFLLGLVLAIGVNVHIRFWIVIFLAAILTLWLYRTDKTIIKKILLATLPTMLLGFIPVLIFNVQHDFPLLNFQLSDRHPWSFQAEHVKFFVIQILVTTPLMFVLLLLTACRYIKLNALQKIIAALAISHWLLYAILGFFSDDLRFNWHWTLLSYILLAIVAGSINHNKKLTIWAKFSGVIASIAFIGWLFWALHISQAISPLNARFTENARGWKELATETETQLQNSGLQKLVTDHFKTLSTLKFYMTEEIKVTSLVHPLNQKHGRQSQIEIMGFLQPKTQEKGLLVVEHSALKHEQVAPFYQQACERLHGIKWIHTYQYLDGLKIYYFFATGDGNCEWPNHTNQVTDTMESERL